MSKLGRSIMSLIDQAARLSEPGLGVTRLFLSDQHRQTVEAVRGWMRDAGMETKLDDAGTLVGRVPGPSPHSPVLIVGSHIDSVRHGGKFDGMLGVLLPIVCLRHLRSRGASLPFAIEIAAFGDEEGVRFPTTLLGSRAFAGLVSNEDLDVTDEAGISLREALERFGCQPAAIPSIARDPSRVLGFVEVHIEQGPVLEAVGQPVGSVTAITGIERHALTFRGRAGHAGATPMTARKDALVGAAEFIVEVDRLCRSTENLVGTVGRILTAPNSINVIPETAHLGLELRSPNRETRHGARKELRKSAESIARARGLRLEFDLKYEQQGIECAPRIIQAFSSAIGRCGYDPVQLSSGAGHDGLAMGSLCDVGMLFVRCRNGLSHTPDESVMEGDIDAAAAVLLDFLANLSTEYLERERRRE
jgi:allantoate deiminase